MNPVPAMLLAAVFATAVAACGDGGVADRTGETPRVPPPGAPPAGAIELAGLGYGDARQAPIVARGGTYFVGAPVAVAAERIDGHTMHAAVTVGHGAVRDAAPAGDILEYLEGASPLRPQITTARPLHKPFVSLAPNARSTLVPYVARAIQIVNSALPREHRLGFNSEPGPAFEAGLDAAAPGEIPIAYGHLPPDVGAITEGGRGCLLGRTPASDAVAGGAMLTVELASLSGSLGFSALEVWTGAPGAPGTGAPWTHRTLDYRIGIAGNRFVQTGGAEGTVTGVFAGPNHEGMGGELERTDLTASFAGRR